MESLSKPGKLSVYLYIPNIIGGFPGPVILGISTACLFVILSQVYGPGFIFLLLLALDIASHWLQMYSTFLLGKNNHKDVKDSTGWLFRLYYGNQMFMAYCCVACEVLYIALFLLAENQPESIKHVVLTSVKQASVVSVLVAVSLFGWWTKQAINVIQMKMAADICVVHDINRKQKEKEGITTS